METVKMDSGMIRSVRSRASLYLRGRMDRVFLGDAHDVEGNLSGLDKTGAAESGRDNLVVTTAGAKEISEFTMLATEAARGVRALEPAHTSDPAFDAAMVLFKTIVEVNAGPVPHRLSQHCADRPWVGAIAIRRHPVRAKAHGGFCGTEEHLRRPHVAPLAQHCVDQVSVPINRPIEVAPPAADLQVGLINVPADTGFAAGAVPPLA
jgi:hypothetical protein